MARVAATSVAVLATIVLLTGSAAGQCVGDCDGDEAVGISELVRCVRIALGDFDTSSCLACDANADGDVRISDLVTAVSHALCDCQTCAPAPTVAPSATPTPTEPPQLCDFNGAWVGEATTVRDSCDDDFDVAPFSLVIAHGDDGRLTAPEGFAGMVEAGSDGCCLSFTFLEPDDEGISCNTGRVCQTPDGLQFTGSVDWQSYGRADAECGDPGAECVGSDTLTASRDQSAR